MHLYAHRGYSAKHPENTLRAFEAALPYVDGIELDVQRTKDGRLVVIHDETVDRTTDGSGYVKDMTLRQLRALRSEGERIPTLEEVFALVAAHDVTVNVELKTDRFDYSGIEQLAWLATEEFGLADRVVFSSFNLDGGRASRLGRIRRTYSSRGRPRPARVRRDSRRGEIKRKRNRDAALYD